MSGKRIVGAGMLLLFCSGLLAGGRIHRVGPDQQFRRPSELVGRVSPGDIIEIMPGTYLNDEAVWRTDNLTVRGVGQRPRLHFDGKGRIANGKAIWVVAGVNMRLENIEFSGAHVAALNGAGLRVESGGLSVRNCYFHHNEFAILTGKIAGTLSVTNSEFAFQRRNGTFAHGVYVGNAERFVFRGNYVHHSAGGHHVKSRAAKSEILYNFLSDDDGQTSYAIDLPNCGEALVMGNILLQGEGSLNHTAISFGAEGCNGKSRSLEVVHNSFVNRYPGGYFVKNHSGRAVSIANNILFGRAGLASGKALDIANVKRPAADIPDSSIVRYLSAVPAIAGAALPELLTPRYQYRHPAGVISRPVSERPAVGAFQPLP